VKSKSHPLNFRKKSVTHTPISRVEPPMFNSTLK